MSETAFTKNLEEMIEFAKEGIVSKTFLEREEGKWVLFCMAMGQSLSTHTSSMPATICIMRGRGRITLADSTDEYGPGHLIHIPANLDHTVDALEDLAFLLVLFRKS